MDFDVELLEITKDNMAEAQFMASNYIDKEVKNRIFLNVIGAEAVLSHLEKFGIDISDLHHIHSVKRIVDRLDISDIILNNIRIDVRVIFDKDLIFVPKSHIKYGIAPDVYVVLKCDTSMARASLYGFFEASDINEKNCNDEYYFVEADKLRSPFELIDFIKNYNHNTEEKLSQAQILRGRELSVAVADHDISDEEFKEFLGLLVSSNELRGSVLEFDNFETLASRVAYALQIKQPKNYTSESVVNIDDFMNLDMASGEEDENLSNENGSESAYDDINGDSLLDDGVVNSVGIEEDIASSTFDADDVAQNLDNDIANIASDEIEDSSVADIGEIPESELLLNESDITDEEVLLTENNENVTDLSDENIVITEAPVSDTDEGFEIEDSSDVLSVSELPEDNFKISEDSLDFSNFEADILEQATDDFIEDDENENNELQNDVPVSDNNDVNLQETQESLPETDNTVDFAELGASTSDEEISISQEENQVDESAQANIHDIDEFEMDENLNNGFQDESEENLMDLSELSSDSLGLDSMSNAVDLTSNAKDFAEKLPENFVPLSNADIQSSDSTSNTDSDTIDDYETLDFSDKEQQEDIENDNQDVNFEIVDDFDSFETIAPEEPNADVVYTDNELSDIINKNSPSENSVAITDKDFTPGEILIDINVPGSRANLYSENEHLEELYNNNQPINTDSVLNNDIRIVSNKTKSVPLAVGIGGIALVLAIVGIILFSIYKFMNPAVSENQPPVPQEQGVDNNLGTDVPNMPKMPGDTITNAPAPKPIDNVVNNSNVPAANVQNINAPVKSIPATSFISVRKLSWEVPDYISYDSNFKQYFQSAGKSLKAALSSDLLLANDYAYSDVVKVSILFDKSGTFKNSKILSSSGSNQIDNIVLQSVNQTLRVLKAPNSLGNDESTTVILKIYL